MKHGQHKPMKTKIATKIRKIMHEGVRGKSVKIKQAVAIAYSMYKNRHK